MSDTAPMTPTTGASAGTSDPSKAGGLQRSGSSELVTEQGTTSIADSVVAKIAGVAAREMSGVHAMGGGTARAFGAIKERMGSTNVGQGVKVEVGKHQAAVDIDLVVDYGVSIVDLSQAVRNNVLTQVERMTGLEVTEVNISVNDVWLGEEEPEEPRVQ